MENSESTRIESQEQLVPWLSRLCNYLIDSVVVVLLMQAYLGAMGVNPEALAPEESLTVMGHLILIKLAYYFGMEALLGKTLAKFITRTQVVDEDGNKPAIGKIAIRTLCRLIPLRELSFVAKFPYGFHDRFSKTYVVWDS